MKTKQEIKKWLLENCLNDNGDLVICDIDLSDFKGNVILSGWTVGKSAGLSFWKVKGNLTQDSQTVNGNLRQSCQIVNGDLYQNCQKVNGNLYQDYQTAENIYQDSQTAENIYQDSQTVNEDLYQGYQIVNGDLYQECQTAKDLYQECQNVSKDLVSQKLKEDEEWVDLQGSDCAVIRAKKLKEISLDELAKMGYKLKEK